MGNIYLILKSIIIGIVEGITEFLPISSTGHMIIVGHFISFEGEFAKLFEIVIQLGAILSIIVLFRNKIGNSLKNLAPGKFGFKLWFNIAVAFIPSGVVGILFHDKVEELLMKPVPVAASLLVGGLWMIYAEKKYRRNNRTFRIEDISLKQAIVIGCFQCLAILWPGFSRSASTIIGGWIVGLSTVAAAEFSFFLALPTMIIATLYSLLKTSLVLSGIQIAALIVGFVVSFIVALIVVDKFIDYLKHKPMRGFAVYRIIVAAAILILAVIKVI
jgi:undecaprenyl-diphosphatase